MRYRDPITAEISAYPCLVSEGTIDPWSGRRVVVTGGHGFVGSAVMARLAKAGAHATAVSLRDGCDLRDLGQAIDRFRAIQPDVVINCAAHQGGIAYQRLYPGKLLYDNLLMSANTIEAARLAGVSRYVNIIAGCAYPGDPKGGVLRESELEAGPMHPSVENYGSAKRAAVHLGRYYRAQYGFDAISLLLINLYGPGEHFHPDRSHGLAALLRKFYEVHRNGGPEVIVWGTGAAVREWLYVDDAAEGILRAGGRYADAAPLNIAVGEGLSMGQLAETIREITGYSGRIVYDRTKPDGALLKVADIARMREQLDWTPPTPLRVGIRRLLDWFDTHYDDAVRETA